MIFALPVKRIPCRTCHSISHSKQWFCIVCNIWQPNSCRKHIRIKNSNYLFSIFHFYPDCCVKIIYNIRFSISKQYKLGMGYLFLTSGNLFSLLIFVWEFIQIYVSNSYCNYLETYVVLMDIAFLRRIFLLICWFTISFYISY